MSEIPLKLAWGIISYDFHDKKLFLIQTHRVAGWSSSNGLMIRI